MKKGMSLPIEIIIIIIIAIVVLVAISTFFTTGLSSGKVSMDAEQRWQGACSALKMRGCLSDVVLDITIQGTPMLDNSGKSLCDNIAGTADNLACCEACCGKGACDLETSTTR